MAEIEQSQLTAENVATYRRYIDDTIRDGATEEDFARSIGSESLESFQRIGRLESALLRQSGLPVSGMLVDVGCGAGRLSSQLPTWFEGDYLGTDISEDLLEFAARITSRTDWRFEVIDGLTIPAEDASADMVCFFSVLTHLRHEESFVYLEEARRVLRPNGRIVFSFLDFGQAHHWAVFDATLDAFRLGQNLHVNQFFSRHDISVWADHLDLKVIAVHDGATPYIQPIDDTEEPASIGQSACVLRKRVPAADVQP